LSQGSSIAGETAQRSSIWTALVAGIGLALVAVRVLHLVGAPVSTDDVWWHMRLGEEYTAHGPWLESDPLLYTASEGAPAPHAWLFGVAVSAVDRLLGLHGLRLAHVAVVVFIIGLAYSILRRESGLRAPAFLATAVFLVLTADRLPRLRPDLFSISATLLLYLLLLQGKRPPSWRRVAMSVLLILVWANFHAAFAVGPLFLVAALFGLTVRIGLRLLKDAWRREPSERGEAFASEAHWIRAVATALVLGLLAAFLNPRGIEQHLSFLSSASGSALWAVADDWSAFHPFSWSQSRLALGLGTWLAADLLLLGFLAAGLYALLHFLREPSASTLRACDPMLFALGAASFAASFVSQRFLWMCVFPLLCVLRVFSSVRDESLRKALAWACALACVGLAFAVPGARPLSGLAPSRFQAYLEKPFSGRYPAEGVRFLAETKVSGNLFSRYATGGFFGYWLAPRVRAFVNGTLNFPAEVFDDYFAAVNFRGIHPDEGVRDVLDRREVDFFFGAGIPALKAPGMTPFYTTVDLEGEPGWILVHRSLDHAIYLRLAERNAENLMRIASYYAGEGISFDPERGLDVGALLREQPEWAIRHRMLPKDYRRLLSYRDHAEPEVRYEALDRLGTVHLLLGDYETQLRFDRQAIELAPRREEPRRRLVYGLLRLGRGRKALRAAHELARIGPRSRAAAAFVRAAEAQMAARPAAPGAVVSWQRTDEVKRLLRQLPVVPSFGYRSGLARQLPLLRGDAIDRETAAGLRGARLPVGGGIRPDAAGVEKSQ
jgi:hypothetical protein